MLCYYNADEKVFVQLGKKHGKFGWKRYHLVKGTVINQGKNDMYEAQSEILQDKTMTIKNYKNLFWRNGNLWRK